MAFRYGWLALFPALGAALTLPSACGSDDSAAGGSGGGATTTTTSTDTGTGGATTTTAAGGGGAAPVTCDGKPYSTVPKGDCDLLAQDCPPGEGCVPTGLGTEWTTSCKTSSGLKGPTKPCNSANECQAGLFCVFGQCAPVCCPDSNEPCGGGTCNVESAFGDYTVFVCSYLITCELLTQDACAPGSECHIMDAMQGLATCVPPSGANKQEGEACQYLNDCGDMQLCYEGICRYNCYIDAMGQGVPGLGGCPVNENCLFPVSFGIDNVGVCLP